MNCHALMRPELRLSRFFMLYTSDILFPFDFHFFCLTVLTLVSRIVDGFINFLWHSCLLVFAVEALNFTRYKGSSWDARRHQRRSLEIDFPSINWVQLIIRATLNGSTLCHGNDSTGFLLCTGVRAMLFAKPKENLPLQTDHIQQLSTLE